MTRKTVWLALAALAACGDGAPDAGGADTEAAEVFDHFGEQLERAQEAEAAVLERKERLDEALEGEPN